MRIVNLNPDTNIGASAWFVEIEGRRLLLDAGTHPKREGRDSLPLYKLIASEPVDVLAISHCHHDHVGSLPVALRYFPEAHVLLTELSYFLVERVLHNSVNVMTRQRDEIGIKEYPLYTHAEVDEIAPVFQGFKYNRQIEWAAHHKARAGLPRPRSNSTTPGTRSVPPASWCAAQRSGSFTPGTSPSAIKPSCGAPALKTCRRTSSSWKPRAATAPCRPASAAKPRSRGSPPPSTAPSSAKAACSCRASRSAAPRKSSRCS